MNISKIILRSAGLAVATTALVAQGFGPGMGGPRGQSPQGVTSAQCGPMGRVLNLTEAQQASMKAVSDRHQAALTPKLAQVNEARTALRTSMPNPSTTDTQLKALQAKVSDAQLAVMLERRVMMQEFETILTPDQKAALEKLQLQGGPGRGMGRGGRGHRGMGPFWN